MANSVATLSAKNLIVKYHKKPILNNINFDFSGEADKAILSIIGENGSGKSTLLKACLGLIKYEGEIFINGENINRLSPKQIALNAAYIAQSSFVPFNYSALEIVLMGRLAHKNMFEKYSKDDEKLALNAMEKIGIAHLYKMEFNKLSGGQKQLCMVARSLCSGAKIFFFDEPVNGLDFGNQIKLLELIKSLSAGGVSVILVAHHPRHIKYIGGEILAIKDGAILGRFSELSDEIISQIYGVDYEKYKNTL